LATESTELSGHAGLHRREPLPEHFVHRPRLVDALRQSRTRLIVVTGPAGSGKTLLVRDWLRYVESPSAWLSLDAQHNDPERLLAALLGALEFLAPGVRSASEHGDAAGHGTGQLDRVVDHLVEQGGGILVVDDLHLLGRGAASDHLRRFLDRLPITGLVVVACSRAELPVSLHRFRLANELVELGASDLRFDVDEAARFFATFRRVEVGPSHVERLCECTEGWAAGLQFAALSLAGREDVDAFVTRFAGSDRRVADFLLDEVLDRQSPAVRAFLLATSVLGRMCVDLCEHVTGRSDAATMLRRIEADNLFLVPLDQNRDWYRYHHLFGQLLQRELRVTDPGQERVAHERAAAWFTAHGQPDVAIGHLLDAGRYDDALHLVARHLHEHLAAGRHETIRSWLSCLPGEYVDSTSDRQLFVAMGLARAGDVEVAKALLERARSTLPGRPEADRQVYAAPVDTGLATVAAHLGYPHHAIEMGTAAWTRFSPVHSGPLPPLAVRAATEFHRYLPVALAWAHALLDDRDATRHWVRFVRRKGLSLPGDLVGALGAEAWAEARSGRLRAAAELASDAIALGTEQGGGGRHPMIGARVALAAVHRERDELEAAVEVLAPHIDAARREGYLAIATLGEVELARAEAARGEPDTAVARLLQVRRDLASRGTPPFLSAVLDRAECRVRLQVGDVERADDLLGQLDPGSERALLEARRALVAGRPDDVPRLLGELLVDGGRRNGRQQLEAAALVARAAEDAHDPARARQALGEVVDAARREGARRTLLDEGFDLDDLVGGTEPGRRRRLPRLDLGGALSERELAVLRYLPSRLSNREIGAELYVSLNTIKSHLKTIYRKLDVEGREAAVRRARQAGLL